MFRPKPETRLRSDEPSWRTLESPLREAGFLGSDLVAAVMAVIVLLKSVMKAFAAATEAASSWETVTRAGEPLSVTAIRVMVTPLPRVTVFVEAYWMEPPSILY